MFCKEGCNFQTHYGHKQEQMKLLISLVLLLSTLSKIFQGPPSSIGAFSIFSKLNRQLTIILLHSRISLNVWSKFQYVVRSMQIAPKIYKISTQALRKEIARLRLLLDRLTKMAISSRFHCIVIENGKKVWPVSSSYLAKDDDDVPHMHSDFI